jgi:ribosome-binding protein aMBF1 (putative translation factor)
MRKHAVHTVDSLLARTEEYGECQVWTGYSTNKTPQVDHNGKMVPVRRLLCELDGVAITGQYFGVRCGTELCVCPEHIIQRSQKGHAKVMAKSAATRRAAKATDQYIARRNRPDTKLDVDKAREIRESLESGPVLAARFGVSRSLVNKIKRGEYWRDHSNPFAGLMA